MGAPPRDARSGGRSVAAPTSARAVSAALLRCPGHNQRRHHLPEHVVLKRQRWKNAESADIAIDRRSVSRGRGYPLGGAIKEEIGAGLYGVPPQPRMPGLGIPWWSPTTAVALSLRLSLPLLSPPGRARACHSRTRALLCANSLHELCRPSLVKGDTHQIFLQTPCQSPPSW